MRKGIILLILLFAIVTPVSAMEFTAPTVPDSGQEFMPADIQSFGDGLWFVLKSAVNKLAPSVSESAGICFSLIAITILVSVFKNFPHSSDSVIKLVTALMISVSLLKPTNSLIALGINTVREISEYGKLLLPVMTAALAAQGGVTSSTVLYTGTALFNAILSSLISSIIVPMIYVYLCLSIANSAMEEDILKNIKQFVKWLMTWSLKIIIYVFTGYIGITGVVSGTVDASAIKATKLAISGFVPVVGGIISDASETILVSAGLMKSAVGVYGLLAIMAVWIGPFLRIGIQYILLKLTSGICNIFSSKQITSLIEDFTGAMGLLLAMTGTLCLLLLISTVCFMKGVS